MSSFKDIPERDIDFLIRSNKLSISSDKYLTVWNFLITNFKVRVPKSVADWINNYNTINDLSIFPDEIVARILSDLDCDQVLSLCGVNKRFNSICKNYKNLIFDKYLEKEGFSLTDYDPRIICKALKLNKRISLGNYFVDGDYVYDTIEIVVDYYGRVLISIVKEKTDKEKTDKEKTDKEKTDKEKERRTLVLKNASNIISVAFLKRTLLLLNSFGDVFITKTTMNSKEIYESKGLVFGDISLFSNKRKNIVQIVVGDGDNFYMLDMKGNVFTNKVDVSLNKNIKEIYGYIPTIGSTFLDINGDIYSTLEILDDGFNKMRQETHLKNIKNMFRGRGCYYITIDNNNSINRHNYCGIGSQLNLDFIPNIDKIVPNSPFDYVLTKDKQLYILNVGKKKIHEVISNVKDIDVLDHHLILKENGDLIVYNIYPEQILRTNVGLNAKLLSYEYILINNKVYYVNITENGIELEEMTV
jgi:hypothetical protein